MVGYYLCPQSKELSFLSWQNRMPQTFVGSILNIHRLAKVRKMQDILLRPKQRKAGRDPRFWSLSIPALVLTIKWSTLAKTEKQNPLLLNRLEFMESTESCQSHREKNKTEPTSYGNQWSFISILHKHHSCHSMSGQERHLSATKRMSQALC